MKDPGANALSDRAGASDRRRGTLDRRAFVTRSAAVGAAAWAVPAVLSTDRVAAAEGSCVDGVSTCEFSTGLEGWTIDNGFGPGVNGLWRHSTERDGGALHYGRGVGGNFRTGNNRNSGAITSPVFEIGSTGSTRVQFTVFRDVENWSNDNYDVLRLSAISSGGNVVLWSAGSDGGTGGAFQSINRPIPGYLKGEEVQFRFDFDTVDGLYQNFEGIYIGRFAVDGCPPPAAAMAIAERSGSRRDKESEIFPPPVAAPIR